jgi:hypothetical protein
MIEWKYEKYLWFSVRAKHRKMLSAKNIFQKNDFPETILRRKPFYVKTNGALLWPWSLKGNVKIQSIIFPYQIMQLKSNVYLQSNK